MKTFVALLITLILCTTAIAGGPIVKRVLPELPPAPLVVPAPAVVTPPPPPPRMRAIAGLTVYMTDYKATLVQNGFPQFNFGEAFGWSTKEPVMEISLGALLPNLADASFTWVMPVERTGTGVPTVPITVGGFTFGPRLGDAITLKTKLSGERFMISTPYFLESRALMPTGMLQYWHLNAVANGAPNATTTSQAPIEAKQSFNRLVGGLGISGESCKEPICVSYKALYALGGHASGWLAQVDIGWKQDNMSACIGYRYNQLDVPFNDPANGHLDMNTNGFYITLERLI